MTPTRREFLKGVAVAGAAVVLDPSIHRARKLAAEAIRKNLAPPPRLTVSEWAERYRILPETASQPGPWSNDITPYLTEIMDVVLEPLVEKVTFMKSSQVGGSEALNNIIGYFMHYDPSPMMLVQPTEDDAKDYAQERIDTMIDDSPVLSGAMIKNKTLSKKFRGGHLAIAGANAPSGLRSRARRLLLFDEVDAYPPSAGTEGDPLKLAEARARTFWNRLVVYNSSPTNANTSRIEKAMNEADEIRHYFVACPHCGHMQTLRFPQLKWDTTSAGRHVPESAEYLCVACAALIPERFKMGMLARGRWLPVELDEQTKEWVLADAHPEPRHVGFHINALYSPWMHWREIVTEFLEAKDDPLLLQVFVNTILGEVWEEESTRIDASPLMKRREVYPTSPLQEGVLLITCGVDIQADRIEAEIVGWGMGLESWSIDYVRIPGDPSIQDGPVWGLLDQTLARQFKHPLGFRLGIAATAVDSGYLTQEVYKYCGDRRDANVWAVKGLAGSGRTIWDRPSTRNKQRVPVYPVGVDTAKRALYNRLRIELPLEWDKGPVPGFCHFPARQPYDEEYFKQLTSEKEVMKKKSRGEIKREWFRIPGRRAETLDCRVYASAAYEGLFMSGIRLEEIRKQMEKGATPTSGRRMRQTGVER